jgi:hypothetical protein
METLATRRVWLAMEAWWQGSPIIAHAFRRFLWRIFEVPLLFARRFGSTSPDFRVA